MAALNLPEVIYVFDQALYSKETEFVWQNQEAFQNVILWMGTFHAICNFLSILDKPFGEAWLRELAV